MLFADALFNIFAGVFDVLNDVRQNVAVLLLFLYSIIPNLDAIIRVRMLLCESSMLLFVSTAAWLAHLVERQSAVREVEGSSPRPDQHSGS